MVALGDSEELQRQLPLLRGREAGESEGPDTRLHVPEVVQRDVLQVRRAADAVRGQAEITVDAGRVDGVPLFLMELGGNSTSTPQWLEWK